MKNIREQNLKLLNIRHNSRRDRETKETKEGEEEKHHQSLSVYHREATLPAIDKNRDLSDAVTKFNHRY